MVVYNFKKIQVVPSSDDFINIVLSRTNRKTPTIIHKGYAISRIRTFYMRKVKFTQQNYHDKLSQILTDFPLLNDIHPFYADLINVLYDRDHYKLALGQLNKCRHLIDQLGKDYCSLIKYGDSLYRCKQLKKAALGRMCTLMKNQKSTLAYLEEVRQHLSRLPSIDPNTRTIILTGYPNVGKSSFMNKITRALVDVQPYAFTTKSLFVGHTDHEYLRWQVIDTPGILDHPLEDRNTIEMQAITALAHLRAAVLYVVDISEQCGYSIAQQVSLFESIRPLFSNKPLIIVLNKIDVIKPDDLEASDLKLLNDLRVQPGIHMMTMSNHSEEGVMAVKQAACEQLLNHRVEAKLKSKAAPEILSKVHVAHPQKRDNKQRLPTVPTSFNGRKQEMNADDDDDVPYATIVYGALDGPPPDWDPTKYSEDLREHYLLANEDWKFDPIPEIMEGHTIADYYVPDEQLDHMLEMLDREETERIQFIEDSMAEVDEDDIELTAEQIATAQAVKERKAQIIMRAREKRVRNHPMTRRSQHAAREGLSSMEGHLADMGIDPSLAKESVRERSRTRGRSRERAQDMDTDEGDKVLGKKRNRSVTRGLSGTPQHQAKMQKVTDVQERANTRARSRTGHVTESDRLIGTKMPRHLFSGKRGNGKTDRR